MHNARAKLALKDGTVFYGSPFGSPKAVSGEVVFNTGMVGYPETMTDPSYHGQILVFTYPLIGNYGVPGRDREDGLLTYFESERIHVQGLVVSDYSKNYSHWNSIKSLEQWMKEEEIPGIYGVDTRELTKKLREQGTMLGKIIDDEGEDIAFDDPNQRVLAKEVCIREPVTYERGTKRIVLVDCGVKNNIIKAFLKRNISIIRVPYDYNYLNEKADGILISNGPGDPKVYEETIDFVRHSLKNSKPIFGICLGSQILALAAGADTYKLKYGHRSQNQPCMEAGTRRCYITSQNHGYAVNSETLPEDWREWFYNLNDRTNEGVIHISKPFFGTQFHPEASPGPDDTEMIFDMFVRAIG